MCREVKDTSEFYRQQNGKHGVGTICKFCNTQKARKYRQSAAWGTSERYHRTWKTNLKLKYGITPEDYNFMLEGQNNVCAICDKPEVQNKRMAVDHCHETGKVRGLLCSMCNTAIGKLNDDPNLLDKAAKYLRAHGGDHPIHLT
jgi:hypothetical protein